MPTSPAATARRAKSCLTCKGSPASPAPCPGTNRNHSCAGTFLLAGAGVLAIAALIAIGIATVGHLRPSDNPAASSAQPYSRTLRCPRSQAPNSAGGQPRH